MTEWRTILSWDLDRFAERRCAFCNKRADHQFGTNDLTDDLFGSTLPERHTENGLQYIKACPAHSDLILMGLNDEDDEFRFTEHNEGEMCHICEEFSASRRFEGEVGTTYLCFDCGEIYDWFRSHDAYYDQCISPEVQQRRRRRI